jgi:Flp pilus assembly protein TadD
MPIARHSPSQIHRLLQPLPWLLIACALAPTACSSSPRHKPEAQLPPASRAESLTNRDISLAQTLTPKDRAAAKLLLQQAIEADPFYGPARNNLGSLALQDNDLFLAAQEFETASRLMPTQLEPRLNLGLTLERANRIDEALDLYTTAHEMRPDAIQPIQLLTRLRLKSGRKDPSTPNLLRQITTRGDSPHWREWAAAELTRSAD